MHLNLSIGEKCFPQMWIIHEEGYFRQEMNKDSNSDWRFRKQTGLDYFLISADVCQSIDHGQINLNPPPVYM